MKRSIRYRTWFCVRHSLLYWTNVYILKFFCVICRIKIIHPLIKNNILDFHVIMTDVTHFECIAYSIKFDLFIRPFAIKKKVRYRTTKVLLTYRHTKHWRFYGTHALVFLVVEIKKCMCKSYWSILLNHVLVSKYRKHL